VHSCPITHDSLDRVDDDVECDLLRDETNDTKEYRSSDGFTSTFVLVHRVVPTSNKTNTCASLTGNNRLVYTIVRLTSALTMSSMGIHASSSDRVSFVGQWLLINTSLFAHVEPIESNRSNTHTEHVDWQHPCESYARANELDCPMFAISTEVLQTNDEHRSDD
jgi:hypothetical protein